MIKIGGKSQKIMKIGDFSSFLTKFWGCCQKSAVGEKSYKKHDFRSFSSKKWSKWGSRKELGGSVFLTFFGRFLRDFDRFWGNFDNFRGNNGFFGRFLGRKGAFSRFFGRKRVFLVGFGFLRGFWRWIWAGAGFLALTGGAGAEGMDFAPWPLGGDWGPVVSRMEDADGALRLRAAGPFYERAEGAGGLELLARPRPLWARAADPVNERTAWDALWPVAAGKTFRQEKSWRVGPIWFYDRDMDDAESQYRFQALPLWFHGRDAEGEGYAALFPLGGEIHEFLMKDRIRFALWPLWTESWKKDIYTRDVLWPIWSRTTTEDGRLEKFRVLPLYAWSKREGAFEKRSVLWPIWTQARYVNPKLEGRAWVLFPLYGRMDLTTQRGWMVVPPLFQFVRGEKLSRTYCPWPFYQRETGAREKLYVWPLYGRRQEGELERRFWLWPLVVHEENRWGALYRNRWSVAPFYLNATTSMKVEAAGAAAASRQVGEDGADAARQVGEGGAEVLPEGGDPAYQVVAQRLKLWPLASRVYNLPEETYRLRLLELWPTGHPPPVERSWAPLWTVLDYRVRGECSDLEAFWGLYRQTCREEGARSFALFPLWGHTRTGGDAERSWSVLKGLLAYDRTATTRRVRFLWLGRLRLAEPPGVETEGAELP